MVALHEVHEGADGGDCGQQRLRIDQQRHDPRQKLRLEANGSDGRCAFRRVQRASTTVQHYDTQIIQNFKGHNDKVDLVIKLPLLLVFCLQCFG